MPLPDVYMKETYWNYKKRKRGEKMYLIQKEKELSKRYLFDTEISPKGKKIVKITQENVAIAEAMMQNDSSYLKINDINAGPANGFEKENSKVYHGSSAFWFTRLREIYEGVRTEYTWDVETIIKNSVDAVDRENGTHLNADKVGRKQITNRIIEIYNNDQLYEWLINKDKEYNLFHKIEEKTEPDQEGMNSRINTSYASKFCHYAAFYLFEGSEGQDSYSIWDRVLRKSLPLYFDKYQLDINEYNLNNYIMYQKAIDIILAEAESEYGNRVSRNGFDHLLWYYYKGRV